MDWSLLFPVAVGTVVGQLWDVPSINAVWLLFGAVCLVVGVGSGAWVALGFGLVCVGLAFRPMLRAGR